MEATRAGTLIAAIILAAGLSAQDTPAWWPERLTKAAADTATDIVYHRPLSQFNHPNTGKPMQIASVICLPSGVYYRAVLEGATIRQGTCLKLPEPLLP